MFVTVERGGAERIMGVSVAMLLGSVRRRGAEFDVLYGNLWGKWTTAQAQMEAATLERSASDRQRAYRAGESGLAELLAACRSLADVLLAQRLACMDVSEADSRFQLDLHRMEGFDD